MKWYDYLILEFQSYKWILFILLAMPFGAAVACKFLGLSVKVPTFILVGLFVAWCIFWLIASYLHRKNIKK